MFAHSVKNTEFCPIESLLGMKTDQELLDDFVESAENRSFEEVFKRHHSALYRKSLRFFRNKEDAEDFLQDFWTYVFRNMTRIKTDEQGSAARFLHSVYLCDLYDYYKRKDWATVRLDDELLGKLHQCPEWSYNSVEDDVYCAEIQEKKVQIINSLPETDRKIYNLYEKHGFSIYDIARYSSLSEGTVRNKISTITALINNRLRPVYTAISLLGGIFGGISL